ncbi:MAG: DUF882 domain-containing protein [Hyphomicrobiales bacterium]
MRARSRHAGGLHVAALVMAALLGSMLHAQSASAETRALKLFNTHTQESATIVFKRNGRYDADGLKKLNWFLRDWRRDEMIKMDPRLFDIVWEVYQNVRAGQAIHVVSGYRSPVTNNALRARSRGVAKASQHTLGKAMDFFIPGVPLSRIREAALKVQGGGVGFYPTSRSPFVHMDTGNVRHWPRMSRKELVRVFPNGRTVHVPSDGKPLPGYELALADIKSGRRSAGSAVYASASDNSGRKKSKGLLASLFSSGEDDREEISEAEGQPVRKPQAEMRSYPSAAPKESAPGVTEDEPLPVAAKPTPPALLPAPAPAMKPAEPEAQPDAAPAEVDQNMLMAAAPIPVAKPRAVPTVVASAGPALAPAPRPGNGQQMQWVTGPAGAPAETPVAEAPAMPAAAPAPAPEAAPAHAPMLIAENEMLLPRAKPHATVVASAEPLPALPAPQQKPLDLMGGRASQPLPGPATLPAYAPETTGSAANAAAALAAGRPLPAARAPAVAANAAAPSVDSEYRSASTSYLLAYNGSDIRPLTAKASARTRALAQLQAPTVSRPTVFETPAQAIENRFASTDSNDLRTDRFSGPAIGRIATIWLGLTGR